LATTSFDGSIATTYKRTVTDTVCDNTRELALSERGQEVKVKHSRNSHAQLGPARQTLAMVHTLADDFAQEVARLCQMEVTQSQWKAFLDAHIPRHDNDGTALTGRSLTTADRKRDTLAGLYRADPRVSPWAGTAHGVLQAVNTYEHHEGVVRGERAERNGLKTITGDFGRLDRTTWKTLNAILEQPLPALTAGPLPPADRGGGGGRGTFTAFRARSSSPLRARVLLDFHRAEGGAR